MKGRSNFWVLFLLCFSTAVEAQEAFRRPGYNVILISLDTLRSDHLGAYGYGKDTSPHIDRFAKESLVFKNSFSNAGWTLPSHMSMMTSLYPSLHGVTDESKSLANNIPTLADVLKGRGYRTAAFTAGYLVAKAFGFDHGFDVFKDNYHYPIAIPGQGWRLKEVGNSAAYWLAGNADQKFFLFLHCYDTHEPFLEHSYLKLFETEYSGRLAFLNSHPAFINSPEYKAHKDRIPGVFTINLYYSQVINRKRISLEPKDREHIIALYDNEIRFVDHYFKKLLDLLDELKLRDRTIIILTSDHGEELFERGMIQHGGMLFDEQIRVPLIIHIPGYRSPAVLPDLAQGIDVAPTILDILGIRPEAKFMGISLLSGKNAFVLGQNSRTSMIRTGTSKLMLGKDKANSLFFDLSADAGETTNAVDAHLDQAAELHILAERALSRKPGGKAGDAKLTQKDIEKLKALGYIK